MSTGSWLGDLMGLDPFPLTLSQEQVSYFATPKLRDFTATRSGSTTAISTTTGSLLLRRPHHQIARDMRGHFIESDERRFEGDDIEGEILTEFLRSHLPDAVGPALLHRTCVYDMPADRDFVVDALPGHPNVTVFNGAGHAGKFASLMGRILADLLLPRVRPGMTSARSRSTGPLITCYSGLRSRIDLR